MKWIIILAIIGVVIWLLKRNRGGPRRLAHRSGEHDHDQHGRGSDDGNGGNGGNGGGE